MNGQTLIQRIISSNLFHAECPDSPKSGCLIVWSSGAAEQLEALALGCTGPRAVGLKDIEGREIYEGDEVMAYVQKYPIIEVLGEKVQMIDITKPRPIADRPIFSGEVVWGEDQLRWEVKVIWMDDSWGAGIASIAMGGHSYAFQIL